LRRLSDAEGSDILQFDPDGSAGIGRNFKSVIFRIGEAGQIIGLPSTLADKHHELTAEALRPRKQISSSARISLIFFVPTAQRVASRLLPTTPYSQI
jgi:hypothetical protein